MANTSYRAAIQTMVNAQTVQWEGRIATGIGYSNLSWPASGVSTTLSLNYYDNYTVPGLPASAPYNLSAGYNTSTKSLLTVSLVNVLGTAQMLWRVNYYDMDGRPVRVITQHYKGGATSVNNYDDVTSSYNFAGEVTSSVRRHYVNGTEALYVAQRLKYDQVGRLKDTYQKTGDNITTANTEVLLSRNNYNEVGQLTSKQLHSTNTGTSFAQTVGYEYNARGWLKIQSAPLFSQSLKYDDVISGVTPQYNGNISRQEWGGVNSTTIPMIS